MNVPGSRRHLLQAGGAAALSGSARRIATSVMVEERSASEAPRCRFRHVQGVSSPAQEMRGAHQHSPGPTGGGSLPGALRGACLPLFFFAGAC